jgi:hypothetical protein
VLILTALMMPIEVTIIPLFYIPHSRSKCNDLVRKRERCDSAYILRLPRKGMHR